MKKFFILKIKMENYKREINRKNSGHPTDDGVIILLWR